jgi:hypothetical protein
VRNNLPWHEEIEQWRNRVDGLCKYEQRKGQYLVEKLPELYITQQLYYCAVLMLRVVYVIWFRNLRVSSFLLSLFNDFSILQSDQNQ